MNTYTKSMLVATFFLAAFAQSVSAQYTKYDRSVDFSTGKGDKDDMCIWVHPTDRAQSTVVVSDKGSDALQVFDLSGNVLQTVGNVQNPGNIDVRYGFSFGGKEVDIVALNMRAKGTSAERIGIFTVDPTTRKLTRVDDDKILTDNYGFTLYKSPVSQKYYAFTSPNYKAGVDMINQFELSDNGSGKISGKKVRSMPNSETIEGMVCDDEEGILYIGEEGIGIRKYNAEPDGDTKGELIRTIANDELEKDVEGMAMIYLPNGEGYIVACSQLDSVKFKAHYDIFDRKAPHKYITSFMLTNVGETDGIAVCTANLGSKFPNGIFVAHNASEYKQLVGADWGTIAKGQGLTIDTAYGNPRKRGKTALL